MQQGFDMRLLRLPADLQSEFVELTGFWIFVDPQTPGNAAYEFEYGQKAAGLSISGGFTGALSLLEVKVSKETGQKWFHDADVW